MLGLDSLLERLGAQKLRPFSFDFSQAGNDSRALESLILKVTSNPMVYAKHDGFKWVVKKLQEFVAEIVCVAGDGGIVTSESTACIVAESLLSESEQIKEGSA